MGRIVVGRYALRSRLGVGGMGEVYEADDLRLRRQVAVKLVPVAGITPVARARFVREAQAAARINSPNAVAVYDAGESDGVLYLVMERVAGRTLEQQLAATGPLPVDEAVLVALAVLDALAAAHASGVVHRDVKPSNILVGPGGVKLADFGIATIVDEAGSAVTAAGELLGTPKYLAPEQITGQPATPMTDLYAVGVVLYEMLTGVAPFDRGEPMATALAHRDEPVPDVRARRPEVPPRVAAVIGTALQKRPTDRYRSAGEMRRALAPAASATYAGDTAALTAASAATVASGGRRWWWVAAAAVAAIGGTVAAVLVADESDPATTGRSSVATQPSAQTGAAPTTTLPTTTTIATTTTIPTTTSTVSAPPPAVDSVEQLVAVLAADPARFGARTDEVVDRLGKLNGRGRDDRRRAEELLRSGQQWVERGELSGEAWALMQPVLAAIADEGGEVDDQGRD